MFSGKFTDHTLLPYSSPNYTTSQDRDLIIHFWGTLYNHQALGFKNTDSNVTVVHKLFLKQGITHFNELDGAFTFIIFLSKQTIIVRDHHGCGSQVYYNQHDFASSLLLLQEITSYSNSANTEALSAFLMFGYIPSPLCALRNTYKLGAGEILIHENKTNITKKLFDIDPISTIAPLENDNLEELSNQYGELHQDAIRKRIGDNQNIGILLSGGYDSGANLAALRQIYSGKIHSYSIGFKEDSWSELPQARCMSEFFQTQHHEYQIDGSEIKVLPEIIKFMGDPFVEGGLMVNYCAMRMIDSSKPSIILGGDGSDQYFGTSGREIAIHALSAKYGIKNILKFILILLNHSAFEYNSQLYRLRFHLDKILNILQGDQFGFPEYKLKRILQNHHDIYSQSSAKVNTSNFNSLYTTHLYKTDIEKTINQVILFKASRMAEMFDNTLTFPYMDTTLYQFLMRLPVKYKCLGNNVKDIAQGHGISKFLLKYHYKPMLPETITNRKKQGGFAPIPIFFKEKKQRKLLTDYILNSSITQDFLHQKEVEKFLQQYDQEAQQPEKWFWYHQIKAIQFLNLLTLSIWWEIFIKKNSTFIE